MSASSLKVIRSGSVFRVQLFDTVRLGCHPSLSRSRVGFPGAALAQTEQPTSEVAYHRPPYGWLRRRHRGVSMRGSHAAVGLSIHCLFSQRMARVSKIFISARCGGASIVSKSFPLPGGDAALATDAARATERRSYLRGLT